MDFGHWQVMYGCSSIVSAQSRSRKQTALPSSNADTAVKIRIASTGEFGSRDSTVALLIGRSCIWLSCSYGCDLRTRRPLNELVPEDRMHH